MPFAAERPSRSLVLAPAAAGALLLATATAATAQITDVEGLVRAVDGGSPGDTVELGPGTFELTAPLVPEKDMTIRGAGAAKTILTGADSWRPGTEGLPKTENPAAYLFENDRHVEIDHNAFAGTISIPKHSGGAKPEEGFTFEIHHNWLRKSYALEWARNAASVHHNLFDFSTGDDKGNLISNHGRAEAPGPTLFHDNLIRNPGQGLFWSRGVYNNYRIYNNHVRASTLTRDGGLFGFPEETDFDTVVIRDNVIECIASNPPAPVPQRGEPRRHGREQRARPRERRRRVPEPRDRRPARPSRSAPLRVRSAWRVPCRGLEGAAEGVPGGHGRGREHGAGDEVGRNLRSSPVPRTATSPAERRFLRVSPRRPRMGSGRIAIRQPPSFPSRHGRHAGKLAAVSRWVKRSRPEPSGRMR